MAEEMRKQDLIFALDIGTRSIIGVVGRTMEERLEVLAIEKEEHSKRAMLDGQIEDIDQVAKVARHVTERLEQRLGCSLTRVCVAAAGRALRTERGHYALELPQVTRIDSDLISRLESGAVSEAEAALSSDREDDQRRSYLVGYTVSSYQLDRYPLATLKGHSGRLLEADVVATFLPSEVVESLYAVMAAAGLEVASLTLEPIAALNAVIPADLRLLNLVLTDIGAGTSDIAVCRDGAVVGYTMATVAGDEITEELMRRYLVDFKTAERMKMELGSTNIVYRDVLGLEQSVPSAQVQEAVSAAAASLAQEVARQVREINGGPPSALFLAGGGSKLLGLRELVAKALEMDERRVALAGNNYDISAFSKEYELNDPEYATPLGIAVSAGLGLISDSYRILLNGQQAKLFRSGTLTALDLLMMNGYTSTDLLGRTGKNLSVTIDGQRMVFRGEPAVPSTLLLNGAEATPSALVYAGDSIVFRPAVSGRDAHRTLADLLGADFPGGVTVNGHPVPLETELHVGDQVLTYEEPFAIAQTEEAESVAAAVPGKTPEPAAESLPEKAPEPVPEAVPSDPVPAAEEALPEEPPAAIMPESPAEEPAAKPPKGRSLLVHLNGAALALPAKPDGGPYYLMDLLDRSGIDFDNLDRPVDLLVNGQNGLFTQILQNFDEIVIRYAEG